MRQYLEPFSGVDFLPPVKQVIGRRAELGDEGAVASMGPAWKVLAPEIEFDLTPVVGGSVTIFRGYSGFLDYWDEWLGLWESYVYETLDYEGMGRWVVADLAVQAEGPQGISIDLRVGQAFDVSDGRIVRMQVFPTMSEARARLGRSGSRGAVDRFSRRR